MRNRRRFLSNAIRLAMASGLLLADGITRVVAAVDPRPEFSSTEINQVLSFYFGTSDAADDASIRIVAPLVTEQRELVPFKIEAPGAEKIAILTDANPEPLILAMDQIADKTGVVIGRARLQKTGLLKCYVLRNNVLTRATRKISVSGHWQQRRA
ncbi:MAG: thiosulfate oxidation carrier protein SoxY [Arenicellales bacterium]